MIVSVRTASLVNTFTIISAVIVSFAVTIAFGIVFEEQTKAWYILVPLCFIVLGSSLCLTIHVATIRWLIWAFKHVNDVRELEKLIQDSALGNRSLHKLQKNHPEAFAEIMVRFKNYEFVDDIDVASDMFIYNRKFYQSWPFIFGSSVAICLSGWFIYSPELESGVPLIILLCIVSGLTIHEFHKISDTSPQITLSEKGIWFTGRFVDWCEVTDYQIITGETSYLEIILSEQKTNIDLDYLNISKVRLNHLMHVYRQRHKRDHSHKKP